MTDRDREEFEKGRLLNKRPPLLKRWFKRVHWKLWGRHFWHPHQRAQINRTRAGRWPIWRTTTGVSYHLYRDYKRRRRFIKRTGQWSEKMEWYWDLYSRKDADPLFYDV